MPRAVLPPCCTWLWSIECQAVKPQHIAKHYEYRGRDKDKTSSGTAARMANTTGLQAHGRVKGNKKGEPEGSPFNRKARYS